MSATFYRHGTTSFNEASRPAGRNFDESLSETGKIQAKFLIECVREEFDAIICSPLKRARETIEPLSRKLNLDVHIDSDLTERSHGHLDGKNWEEIKMLTEGSMTLSVLHSALEHDFSKWGGDTIEEARIRVRSALSRLIEKFDSKRVLVMTHGGIIKIIYALSGETKPKKIPNISGHTFEWEVLKNIVKR